MAASHASTAPYEKPTDRPLVEPPEGEKKLTKAIRKATIQLRAALKRSKIKLAKADRSYDTMPFVRATGTVEQIRRLSGNKLVGAILFDDRSAIADLSNSMTAAQTIGTHYTFGYGGRGVHVAVWEDGPSNTTNLFFVAQFTATPPASAHARLTSAIVKNTEPNLPHGHAPDCDLYSANSFSNGALLWAVDDVQRCTVVSQSFHRSTGPGGSGLQSDDLLKDWLALRYPFPTIVQAADNFFAGDADGIIPPQDEFVNHKGYNSLTVGNHDDTVSAIAGDSAFRNPTTAHGDRELPKLAANGVGVSAVGETIPATCRTRADLTDLRSSGIPRTGPNGSGSSTILRAIGAPGP